MKSVTAEGLSSSGRKLLSGSAIRVGNLIAAAASSFFLMPFVVHHLGDRLYGFWSVAAAFISYYSLLDFGLSSAVSQYLSIAIGHNDPEECRSVFNSALRIQTLLGGVALLVTGVIAAAAPWLTMDPADAALFWKVIVIMGMTVAIGFPARAYGGVLECQLLFNVQSAIAFLGVALRTGLTVLVILEGGSVLALSWISLFATVPVIVLNIWFARRDAPWARIDFSFLMPKGAKRLFSYSIYTFLGIIGDMFRFQLDSLVIAGFIGLVAVTHYRVASAFSAYYISLVGCALGMLQPVLSRLHGAEDRVGLEKVFFFATKVSFCISVFVGFSLIAWGKPFIARWMGPNYKDAYWPLVVLTLAILLDVGQNPSITLLYATFKHRFYTYLNCAEGLINLVVSLLLARPLGVLGVALGTLIAAVVIRVVAQPLWVCKVSGLHYGNYMKFLRITLLRCGGLVAAAILISAWGLRPSYPWLVGSAICATVIYAVGSWFIVFDQTERGQLRALVIRRDQKQSELSPVGVALQ